MKMARGAWACDEDIEGALNHASDFYGRDLGYDDICAIENLRLDARDLDQWDDLSSWAPWSEGEFLTMSRREIRAELEAYRDPEFADLAESWLRRGKFPTIVVVAGDGGTMVGDGRGRVSVALAARRRIPVIILEIC